MWEGRGKEGGVGGEREGRGVGGEREGGGVGRGKERGYDVERTESKNMRQRKVEIIRREGESKRDEKAGCRGRGREAAHVRGGRLWAKRADKSAGEEWKE